MVLSQLEFCEAFRKWPLLRQAGFFVCPGLTGTSITPEEQELLRAVQPMGVILFKRNFQSLLQAQALVQEIRTLTQRSEDMSEFSTFICVDEEGGRVSRLPLPFPRGKPVLEFAETGDEEGLVSQVLHQAWVAKGLGINGILAPVADILTEPTNPVVGDRAPGRTALETAHYAGLIAKALADQGVLACAKHFPGHGDTTTDSHLDFATSSASLATLRTREWIPFQSLIQQGIPLVMSAHVLVPSLDATHPATLSSYILKDILRKELGFSGLILSDDLRMKAIAHYYGSVDENDRYLTQAAPAALRAGCDILLSCESIAREKIVIDGVCDLLKQASNNVRDELTEKAWRIYQGLSSNFV